MEKSQMEDVIENTEDREKRKIILDIAMENSKAHRYSGLSFRDIKDLKQLKKLKISFKKKALSKSMTFNKSTIVKKKKRVDVLK